MISAIAWSLAAILSLALIIALIGLVVDIIHHPEYKNLSTFSLAFVWELVSMGCVAVALFYSKEVAADHSWAYGILETVAAFCVAALGAWKLYKSTDFFITGIDYDAIMGKKRRN